MCHSVSNETHTVHTVRMYTRIIRIYVRTYTYHYIVVWGCTTGHNHCPPAIHFCHTYVHTCFRNGNNMPAPRCHLAERCNSWWSSFLSGASWNSSECRAVSLPISLCCLLLLLFTYPSYFFSSSSALFLCPLPLWVITHTCSPIPIQ